MTSIIESYRKLIESTLNDVLPNKSVRPTVLSESMRYAVGTGGKRIRPLVCLASAEAVGGAAEDAAFAAAAIELLHNYTLVHDDLPAMDGDVERRGQPSVWKKFGEANAILCGDALQALAFGVAARVPRQAAAVVSQLAFRGVGVVRGQIEDVAGSSPDVPFVYEHKTADLFMAAAAMGALAGGGAPAAVERLRLYALHLGLAFQFQDDLLDDDSPLPKDETERRVTDETEQAIAALSGLPGKTAFLKDLARELIARRT